MLNFSQSLYNDLGEKKGNITPIIDLNFQVKSYSPFYKKVLNALINNAINMPKHNKSEKR
jgi:hypothetical protein